MSKSTYKDEEPITWQLIIKECTRRAGDDVADIFIGVQSKIEKLEAENKRLRKALRSIAQEEDTLGWLYAAHRAKTALEKESNDEGE